MTMGHVGTREVRRYMQDASILWHRLFALRKFAFNANSPVRYSQGNRRTDSPVFYGEVFFGSRMGGAKSPGGLVSERKAEKEDFPGYDFLTLWFLTEGLLYFKKAKASLLFFKKKSGILSIKKVRNCEDTESL